MPSIRFLILPLLFLLAACASSPRSPEAPRRSLLLLSLDGVHPDFLGRGDTPHIDRLADRGVRAEWMVPSYPVLTFPNHYTLVTGLRPDRHGIVHNTMQDEALGQFEVADRDAVGDARWWGGEPVWVAAERAGLATATLFWPGSEAAIGGVRPRRWHAYDEDWPIGGRFDTLADWLTEPAVTHPQLVAMYLEHADYAAHTYGPRSPQLRAAMRTVDDAIGSLLARLQRAGVRDSTDIVIVSDHGIAEVPDGQAIATEDMVDPEDAALVTSGQVIGFRPLPGREQAAERRLLGRHAQYECWRRHELPPRWRHGTHPRVAPIVCQMDLGWDALPRKRLARRPSGTRGSHAYDPASPELRAIFIANGPSFRSGVVLPAFDNTDVYPLLARLLGIRPAEHDGRIDTLLPALREAQ
jgi:predicted AlkP superfamily pyrophosphatase or phosphodiesterase